MMIDLHCHILAGVDDGPATMLESVLMGRQAAADGITAICATPHIRADHDVEIAELAGRVSALNAALAAAGVPVRALAGGEVAEEIAPGLSDAELAQVTLGASGRWVLLEPRPGPLGDALATAIAELAARGLRCVIAHPERHAGPDVAERLAAGVAAGALVQVTAALVAEGDAATTILDLAARGLVHVLGSDAHHPAVGRRMELSPALARLGEVATIRPHLRWIAETAPAAIVNGEDLTPPFAARP